MDAPAHEPRFTGIARLYGHDGLEALRRARVAIVGIGGVGTWVAESLARTGIGHLDLIDLDDVCATNTNRQLHTLTTTVGRPKAEAMAERVRAINPEVEVRPILDFFTARTAEALITPELSFVVDAIDGAESKCLLIRRCRELDVPLVVCGGAGGRRDPTLVKVGDLTESAGDRLLARVRKQLRQKHGFSRKGRWSIPSVYSVENPVFPTVDGGVCSDRAEAASLRLDCATGYGTASFITGTFGLMAASIVVNGLVLGKKPKR
jgi:tRNA A37 threonylcarbamoyladenosine dehydratase